MNDYVSTDFKIIKLILNLIVLDYCPGASSSSSSEQQLIFPNSPHMHEENKIYSKKLEGK